MARKRPELTSIFKRTEGPVTSAQAAVVSADKPDEAVPAWGRTVSVGVGLKEGELARLGEVAAELGIARNALHRYAVRYFLKAHAAGEIDVAKDVEAPQPVKRLRMR